MEAESTKIPLKGIERNTPDATCEDGAMDEVINLRYKDGAYRPVAKAQTVFNVLDEHTEKVYVHRNSGYEHWIRILGGYGLEYFGKGVEDGEIVELNIPQTIYVGVDIINISFVGNIICIATNSGMKQAIWKGDKYICLNSLPELPVFQFYAKPEVRYSEPANKADGAKGEEAVWNKMFGIARNDGLLNGITLVRYALKLYDGNYAMHSNIVAVQTPLESLLDGSYTHRLGDSVREFDKGNGMQYAGVFYKLLAGYIGGDREADEWSEKWKDIISSIDIFASKSISYYKYVADSADSSIVRHYVKTDKELIDEISDTGIFYKMCSINTNDLVMYGTYTSNDLGTEISLKNVLNNMEAKNDTLPDDSNSHDLLIPKSSFVYNSKLHIGNLDQFKFRGFDTKSYITRNLTRNTGNGNPEYNFNYNYMITRLNIGGEIIEVVNVVTEVHYALLDTFIMYPDINAYEIELIKVNIDKTANCYRFPLTKSRMLNMAFFCDSKFGECNGINKIVTSFDIKTYVNNNNSICRNNVLKVSKVNNPFVFAAENTYTCGNGNILGIASLIGDVSSGTSYGTFPLYVFCSDGIKMLETGTADVYYTNTSDASKEVCTNSDSITPTGSGVAFITDRGLMIINGTEVQEISTLIEGKITDVNVFDKFKESITPSLMPPEFDKYFVDLTKAIADYTFLNELKNAKVGYSYKENELFICPSSPNNSVYYVYNINSNTWSKRMDLGEVIGFINRYPDLFALNRGCSICNISDERDNSIIGRGCLLLTRPIKLGTDGFKKATRAVLRGNFIMSNVSGVSNGAIRFLVYGSIDCMNWYLIGGTDNNNINAKDIGSTLYRYKARYYRFAFIGKLNAGTQINYLEIAADERLGNKIR